MKYSNNANDDSGDQ